MTDSETIKQIVENYHGQLEIVGGYSEISLYKYLKGIVLSGDLKEEDIMFALEYNEDRHKSLKELIQNKHIQNCVKVLCENHLQNDLD